MKTKAVSIEKVVSVPMLPDGEYRGVWGGYEVSVEIYGLQYHMQTTDGIRTPSVPCVVSVENGSVTIEVVNAAVRRRGAA